MPQTRIVLDPAFTVGEVDRRIFGSFVEHMGRCVYTGIYEPGHPSADEHGLPQRRRGPHPRGGRDLCATPAATSSPATGGRTASVRSRTDPARLDLAWRSIETNEVGLNEFAGWAAEPGSKP